MGIASIRDGHDVFPCMSRIAGMHSDRIAVHAAGRFVGLGPFRRSTGIPKHKLAGCTGDGFADGCGRESLLQCGSGSRCCLFRRSAEQQFCETGNPLIIGNASGFGRHCRETVRDDGGQPVTDIVTAFRATRFQLDAVVQGLPEHGVGVQGADEPQHIPGTMRKNDAVNFRRFADSGQQAVPGSFGGQPRDVTEQLICGSTILLVHEIAYVVG